MTPGERLKAARERLGLTQAGAAARAGVLKQTWYSVETGRRAATLDRLHAYATAIGADPHEVDPRLAQAPKPARRPPR